MENVYISYGETHFDVSILLAVLQNSVLGKNFQKHSLIINGLQIAVLDFSRFCNTLKTRSHS